MLKDEVSNGFHLSFDLKENKGDDDFFSFLEGHDDF